jgi:hypothetical protein
METDLTTHFFTSASKYEHSYFTLSMYGMWFESKHPYGLEKTLNLMIFSKLQLSLFSLLVKKSNKGRVNGQRRVDWNGIQWDFTYFWFQPLLKSTCYFRS